VQGQLAVDIEAVLAVADAGGAEGHLGKLRGSVNRPKLPLVDSRKSDQVDAGERTANLLHPAASDEVAEVDGEEACVLEQRDHLGLRIDVVAGDEDHSLAPSLVGICAEDRSAEGVRGLDDARTADEAGDTLA
jgi:hypothetical protein